MKLPKHDKSKAKYASTGRRPALQAIAIYKAYGECGSDHQKAAKTLGVRTPQVSAVVWLIEKRYQKEKEDELNKWLYNPCMNTHEGSNYVSYRS